MCGFSTIPPGAPTTRSFIHGFFSVAQLGQYAREGLALVARWGIPQVRVQIIRTLETMHD